MQLTSIVQTRAAYWAYMQVLISINQKARDFGNYYNIFIYNIKEQRSDQDESKWKR